MKILNNYKYIFVAYATFFILMVSGVIPRESTLAIALLLSIWTIWVPLREGVLFFVASIPLMVAIPFTESFDSLNIWRILSIILFIKSVIQFDLLKRKIDLLKEFFNKPIQFIKNNPFLTSLILTILLSVVSILWAPHLGIAIKRVIYFLNLSLIGVVIFNLAKTNEEIKERLFSAINISLVTVILVGAFQVISTYFIDIYQFMRIWGEGIQCNQFGNTWCYIAVNIGNTWFAYYGEQLSLRVFSLFPDSHSFPVFALLGLPALFALTIKKARGLKVIEALKTRVHLGVVFIPVVFLLIILSGTRGIWAASIGVPLVALIMAYIAKKKGLTRESSLIAYIASYLTIFFVLFLIAFPIFSSPQFLLSKGDNDILKNRIRSIVDFGETSNSQRIEIWKQTLDFIKREPLTGIGIGNYPLVLDQKIELSKAGSSAHNIYLHVWAELGLLGLILLIYIFWKIFHLAWLGISNETTAIYSSAMLLVLPWVYAYLMTDPILFDERIFLIFAATVGILSSNKKSRWGNVGGADTLDSEY